MKPDASEACVWLVDDNPDLVLCLVALLDEAGFTTAGFTSPQKVLDTFSRTGASGMPLCLLTDFDMPEMDGITLGVRMSELGYRCSRLLMSGVVDLGRAVHAMQVGFDHVLEKPITRSCVIDEVGNALQRSRELLAHQAEDATLIQRAKKLTARERKVLDLIADGMMNKQVADQMDISIKTVETYRSRLMRKLAAQHLAELILLGLRLREAGASERDAGVADQTP